MEIRISRKFSLRPYEIHDITVSLDDKEDLPSMEGSLIERILELRRIATRVIRAEMYVYGQLPEKEIVKQWEERDGIITKTLIEEENKKNA